MRQHRVSMLGSLRRRPEDPQESSDPRIRTVVERLQSWEFAPAPDPQFRDELRAQLVAVTGRVVAESSEGAPTPRAAAHRRRSFARPIGIAATVTAALVLLLVGAVFLSQRALPGDSLYGLKRATEDVRMDFTSGDEARGHAYLERAQTRVEEAQKLAGRTSALGGGLTADAASPQTQARIANVLASSDRDLLTGWTLLKTQAQASHSMAPVDLMLSWIPSQQHRLTVLAGALPAVGPAREAATHSLAAAAGAKKTASGTKIRAK